MKINILNLLKLYIPYKWTFILILINTCIITVSDLVYPYITKWVTTTIIYEPKDIAMKHTIIVAISLILLALLQILTSKIDNKANVLSDNIYADLQKSLFKHYQYMSFSYYDKSNTGEIMSIVDGDTSKVADVLYFIPTTVVNIVVTIFGCCIVFSDINFNLFIVLIPIIPLRIIYEFWVTFKLQKLFEKVREICRRRFTFIEDKLAGIRTVISFGNEDKEIYEFNRLISEEMTANRRKWHYTWLHGVGNNLFESIYYIIIHAYGLCLVLNNHMSISDLVIFYMYSYMIINPIRQLSWLNKSIREGIVSFNKIQDVLKEKLDITNDAYAIKPNIQGYICMNNISFKYIDNDRSILNKLNLTIHKNEFLAIVGPSGSGKSTIAGLIPRYYDIDSGEIFIDGINIKQIDLHHLRRNVGVLQQDVYLFNGTIRDNITYGVSTDIDEDMIIDAAIKANALEFINKLPKGFDSEIGERGVKLSGGQKQRISIARLFLVNPPILIFDEATSSLDNESELLIQQSLKSLTTNRTTIVIAHRLSTIKNADRIVFLTENGIEEEGTHDELLAKNGKYAKLYQISI